MSCWCGHGPWHHWGYAYPPPGTPPYPGPRRRRGQADEEDLADYLRHLEEELARARRELEHIRGGGEG